MENGLSGNNKIVIGQTGKIVDLTYRLMDELGRKILGTSLVDLGWKFEFHTRKLQIGTCFYRTKRICFSRNYINNPMTEIELTIRHEIAHAIDFHQRGRSGHDRRFKVVAMLCGTNGGCNHKNPLVNNTQWKYTATCPNCGKKVGYARTQKRYKACADCCNKYNFGRYDKRFNFIITQNY